MGRQEFRTRPDGTVYPLTGKKGKVGAVAVAATAVVALGMSTGTLGLSIGGSGAGGVAGMSAKVAKAGTHASKGKHIRAWRQLGLRQVGRRSTHQAATCVAHSYGQVEAFFVAQPCRALRRTQYRLEDSGNEMVVSVAWVSMPDSRSAVALRALADRDGTGNIAPIGMRDLQSEGIKITGDHYRSRRHGSRVVVIAEAEIAGGSPPVEQLNAAATTAARLPVPKSR